MVESGVAKIENEPENPFELFSNWFQEAKSCGHLQPDAMCFSTASSDGTLSSRTVILRRLDKDGIVIVTDRRSKKSQEIKEHPQAAVNFLWVYMKDGQKISKQVRLEGKVYELNEEEYEGIYEREPLFCKLRSHVCHQGKPTTWQQQNERHEDIYEAYKKGDNKLIMPDHFVGYKFTPHMFDFYFAYDQYFADRVCYLKEEGQWQHFHINA